MYSPAAHGVGNAETILSMGLFVADVAQGAVEAVDPSEQGGSVVSDAERGWLWLKHSVVWGSVPGFATASQSGLNTHVDVRVKRKLLPHQALVLAAVATAGNPSPDTGGTFIPALRTLISRVA